MITRSNLAEQLREYQIRSKHDWASVSFFSSTSNFTSSRVDVVAFETCFYLSLHHIATAFMHENYKASKTGPEKETKDASSIIYVEVHEVGDLFSNLTLLYELWIKTGILRPF
ncbi:hypothetical protein F0562_026874 [Nyssa sinensis]|uniref:Uncharacterized protein n=1 Tax=Nyssa sinensis TaxID=561372 RepID=A0A5J5B3Y3_9ASTE|nr:hypothetical protein F0562_026874 [Nyssa sinensis]